jgi:hypothetical protein
MHYLAKRPVQLTRNDNPNGSMEFNMQLYMETIKNASHVSHVLIGWRSSLSSNFQWTCFFSKFSYLHNKNKKIDFPNFVGIKHSSTLWKLDPTSGSALKVRTRKPRES